MSEDVELKPISNNDDVFVLSLMNGASGGT